MEAAQESIAEKKARNHPKRSSKTHRFVNPSRTHTTPPGNFYHAKMERMLNPAPYPISSSSSLPHLDTQYSVNRFQQPPLLPLPVTSLSSSSSSSSCEFNKKLDKKCTKQGPKLSSTCKPKKYPGSNSGHHGGFRREKGWIPDPQSEKPNEDVMDEKEMRFCESLIYAMSPSPSSLPMPKFATLKPKLTF